MAIKTSNFQKMLYNSFISGLKAQGGKILKETCPKHHFHLILLPHMKKGICPVEYGQLVNNEYQKRANNIYNNAVEEPKKELLKSDSNFLYDHSIVGDPHIKKASFSNFLIRMNKTAPVKNYKASERGLKKYKDKAESTAKLYCFTKNNMYFNTVLQGGPGRGKSHLAMSILKYVNRHIDNRTFSKTTHHYPRCMFVDTNELMRIIKHSFQHPQKDNEEHLVKLLSHVYLLVLDDFGAEVLASQDNKDSMTYSESILYEILNNRERTIFTTNYSLDELNKRYNTKIVSRMLGGAKNHLLVVPKDIPDHRMAFQNM